MHDWHPKIWLYSICSFALVGCGGLESDDTFGQLYTGYFEECASCHAPGAPGSSAPGIEATLNFESAETALDTIKNGSAAGLDGVDAACNGIPFIGASAAESLIVAVVDEDVKALFDVPSHPGCDNDSISDMTVKVGGPPDTAWLDQLKAWIDDGALEDGSTDLADDPNL